MLKLFEMWCDVVTSKPAYELILVERFGHGNKGGTGSVVLRPCGTQRIEGWYWRAGVKDYPMSLSSCNIRRYHGVNCLRPSLASTMMDNFSGLDVG